MATKTRSEDRQQPARRQPVRQAITFELVHALTPPRQPRPSRCAATFGLEPVDYAAIREATEEHIVRIAQTLRDNLNEKAMPIHLQRVVGSFVSSAYGAAQFYGTKKSDALRPHHQAPQRRPRRGPRRRRRLREQGRARPPVFAAEMGLQAFALMAAAEGAVSAYAHITGDEWKPYERAQPPPAPSAASPPPR